MKKKISLALVAAVTAAFALPALAQVDIEPIPQPIVVERALAAPRLAIAAQPDRIPAVDAVSAANDCRIIGATHNFARRDARMVIREGTGIDFTIPFIEGVIYDRACGWLAIYVRFEVREPDGRWRIMDSYFRHARFCGPTIANARDVVVNSWSPTVGEYLVRAIVNTYAIPLRTDLSYDRSLFHCADIESNTIYTKIRVVETPTPDDVAWEAVEPVEVVDARIIEL